jgi:hypothetical protein
VGVDFAISKFRLRLKIKIYPPRQASLPPLKRGIKGKCKVAPYGKTLWRGKPSATKKEKAPLNAGLGGVDKNWVY